MKNNKSAVIVKDLYKSFKLPHDQHSGIKQLLVNFNKHQKGYELQRVLNDISFDIQEGDFFGIVGRNGSGKSTLLKLLAGIYTPDKGLVRVNGSLTPFIELGVGFNPELTGRENVFLNGALLGFSRKEMEVMYDDIVQFAELKKFMDQKLKNYSSGMQVRLAFSIAIRADSDILLLDEVLAVGDEAFQRKCFTYFQTLKNKKKTVILVTHDMGAVRQYCNKAILIENGEIVKSGHPDEVSEAYSEMFNPAVTTNEESNDNQEVDIPLTRWGTEELKIKNIKVESTEARIKIKFEIKVNDHIQKNAMVAYTIKDRNKRSLFGKEFYTDSLSIIEPGMTVPLSIDIDNIIGKGKYYLDLSIMNVAEKTYYDAWIDCRQFSVDRKDFNPLNVLVDAELNIETSKND